MLIDCIETGSHTELFIVEGKSAADALARVREPRHQAVLAVQGKLPNAERTPLARLHRNPACAALFETLGTGTGPECDVAKLRYGHILVAMDGNSDGLHCRQLALAIFDRHLHPLLAERRVAVVTPPSLRVRAPSGGPDEYACTPHEVRAVERRILSGAVQMADVTQYRGLAQLPSDLLRTIVLDPSTRSAQQVTVQTP